MAKVPIGLQLFSVRGEVAKDLPATLEAVAKWQTLHRFDFCGEPAEIAIERIEPISQPMGTLYQALLDGQLDDPADDAEGSDRLVGIIDAGHAATS
jgi:hypothetical protein